MLKDDDMVFVCTSCFRASCWNGIFYCDDYKNAGIMLVSVAELRRRKLEDPSYWHPADEGDPE